MSVKNELINSIASLVSLTFPGIACAVEISRVGWVAHKGIAVHGVKKSYSELLPLLDQIQAFNTLVNEIHGGEDKIVIQFVSESNSDNPTYEAALAMVFLKLGAGDTIIFHDPEKSLADFECIYVLGGKPTVDKFGACVVPIAESSDSKVPGLLNLFNFRHMDFTVISADACGNGISKAGSNLHDRVSRYIHFED